MNEEVSAGNPYRLTKNQHFHLSAIINNFCIKNKTKVIRKKKGRKSGRPINRKAQEFIGNRCWSQEAETTVSWPIENKFLDQANRVIAGLEITNHEAISEYHLLWSLRYPIAQKPFDDYVLYPGLECAQLDKVLEEQLESMGKMPVRPNGVIAGRFYSTVFIKEKLKENIPKYAGIKWKVLKAIDSEFLSADFYDGTLLLPIHPEFMLQGTRNSDYSSMEMAKEEVIAFNRRSIEIAHKFYFYRKLYC